MDWNLSVGANIGCLPCYRRNKLIRKANDKEGNSIERCHTVAKKLLLHTLAHVPRYLCCPYRLKFLLTPWFFAGVHSG